MTAPYLGAEEARDEKAGDDVRVLGDHGIHDGIWGFTDGSGELWLRCAVPEQLLR